VTTRRPTQPAPHDQAGCQLAVVAVGFTVRCITSRLSRIGDTPVLTIEDPAGGPERRSPDAFSPARLDAYLLYVLIALVAIIAVVTALA